MNKLIFTYFLYGLLTICLGQELFAISIKVQAAQPNQTLIDSIPLDGSSIERRQFDNLREKYQGDEFDYDITVEKSGWWSRFKHWLNELFKDWFQFESINEASKATDIALKVGGVIIFLLVIYFIFRAIMNEEGNWVFGKSSDRNIIPVTDIESNLHTADFGVLIAQAEKEHDYRLAIRYYYLWLLKALANAEIIEYDVEKTNSDYYREISPKHLKEGFSYTSYLYNYIWYGEFQVDKVQFEKAKTSFDKFLKSIKA